MSIKNRETHNLKHMLTEFFLSFQEYRKVCTYVCQLERCKSTTLFNLSSVYRDLKRVYVFEK